MRLIDTEALGVGRCSKDILPAAYCAGWNGLLNIINDAPTIDAVPVVRCRGCKWYRAGNGLCEWFSTNFVKVFRHEDDFCSDGESKEADNG